MNKQELVKLILERLNKNKNSISAFFNLNRQKEELKTQHCFIDELLAESIVKKIYDVFPSPEEMRKSSRMIFKDGVGQKDIHKGL